MSESSTSKTMSMTSHLMELRKRLLAVLLVFGLVLIGGFLAAEPIYHYLTTRGSGGVFVRLNAFSFWDGVGIYMKIALTVAFGITLPFTFYQLWAFVSPGLKAEERRATLKYIPFAFLSFVGGAAFGYYAVFPLAIHFTSDLNKELGLVETYGAADYFRFLTNIVVPVSLVFELPLMVLFLTHLRLVNPPKLRKMRKMAYFALVVASAAITPPDFISAFIVLIPLLLLYEFSIVLSARVYRKQNQGEGETKE
ncbi:twin-arginine translocase subunit TatC [Paenibacillus physcomitrellae]|uniref:Sec-independent protein translocase protein TatC n=1 Tax=Paenibacillus physcomitrellae TaxID=1619311 RepID=A0ABQ1FS23_9BACL|nr:twin-arginine translocase subunit TatC [Paenibacillus physcomitrellae]GGA27694.1 Sec-independent protein translocase protein TatCy [Paenibacillus physcomitrellae]